MKKKNLLFLMFLFAGKLLQAQTWNGSAGTDWNTTANWTPATVPSAASTVTIPNTVNKPVLANNIILTFLTMSAGSALDFNGFTLTVSDHLDIRGSVLNNSNIASDIIITINGTVANFFAGNSINDNISINYNSDNIFYEAITNSNTYNGNTTFNITNTGTFYTCYNQKSFFNGNLTVSRTVAGPTYLFDVGFNALTGNFSYTNNAGGLSNINSGGNASGTIGGTVNISATGAGNPAFILSKITNSTTGGTITVQNSGGVTIQDNTLTLSALNVNDFTTSAADFFRRNSITGNVTFSDIAGNTSDVRIGENTITGNTIFTSNAAATIWYESITGSDIYNGNTTVNINSTGTFYTCYDQKASFNGNLTVNRTGAGPTHIFNVGFNALTGNFSYINNAGGLSNINPGGNASATIAGTVNISVSGAGNPSFNMSKVANSTTGGSIAIQNSGGLTFQDNTLMLATLSITDFTGSATDFFRRNNITSNITFSDIAGNTGDVRIGENIINGTIIYTANATGVIWYESLTGSDTYNGNITVNRNAGTINIAYDTKTYINQNLVLNAASGIIIGNNGIEFGGGTNAIIEQLDIQPISMPTLIMNKTGGASLTLNDSVTVTTTATFTTGNIISGANKHLIFSDNAVHTGASVASHVTGPISKIGNDAFTFPVGTPTSLNTVAMTAPAGTTSKFSAQYFKTNPSLAGYDINQHDGTIQKISSCEYWDIQRLNGASNVTLTFSFAAPCAGNSGYISNPTAARIAHWTGATWENLGNGGSTGTTTGTITTAGAVINFSPFTFGSADLVLNPLPVKFDNVKAYQQGTGIKIDWSNFTESNLVNYTIERSADGQTFTPLSTVNPALNNGSRADYYYFDPVPFNGINFYRIQSLETGGKKLYSAIVKVDTKGNKIDLTVYPNPVTDGQLLLQTPDLKRGSYTVTVVNGVGQQVYIKSLNHNGGFVTQSIQLPASLKPGIYNIQMTGDGVKLTKTFLVQ